MKQTYSHFTSYFYMNTLLISRNEPAYRHPLSRIQWKWVVKNLKI